MEVMRDSSGKWLPGTVPNPGGRPVKLATSIRRAILGCSELPIPDCLRIGAIATLPADATMLEAVTMAAMEQACKGNMSAFIAVRDSVDGPISQRVDVHHSGNNPIAGLTGQALLDATLALLQGRTPMSVAEIVDVEAARVSEGGDETDGSGVAGA